MNTTALERLKRVLGERKPHAWGPSVGWNRGVVDRLQDGGLPGPEFLAALGRVENVNLNWLLSGECPPYRTAICASDLQAAHLVETHFQDSREWQPYLLEAKTGYAVVLTLPAELELKGKTVAYTAVEVVAGGVGSATILKLHRKPPTPACELVPVSAEELVAIESGDVGTWDLIRADGILSRRRGAPDFKMVRDAAAHYASASLQLDPTERRILDHIKQLSSKDRDMIEELLARILPTPKGHT